MDEVDFTILAATSVFSDLIEKCPPAEACRDAIDRTARATIRMANSTGGFGQTLPPKGTGPRTSSDQRDWAAARSDSASNKSYRHQHRMSAEHPSQRSTQFDLPSISDAYTSTMSSGTQLPPMQSSQFRPNPRDIKRDPDGFSMMRSLPGQPHSNASGSDLDNSAIDPSLLPSPTTVRTPPTGPGSLGSPSNRTGSAGGLSRGPGNGNMAAYLANQQQQGQAFSPGSLGYGELQGMDFLQNVGGANGTGVGGIEDTQMDLGMGLGWEGLHHDFSDGQQQYDLFDGFFFGGQQGGGVL